MDKEEIVMRKTKRIVFLCSLITVEGIYLLTLIQTAFHVFLFCETNVKWMTSQVLISMIIIIVSVFWVLAYFLIRCGIYTEKTYWLAESKNSKFKPSDFCSLLSGLFGTILCVILALIGLKCEIGYEFLHLVSYLISYALSVILVILPTNNMRKKLENIK